MGTVFTGMETGICDMEWGLFYWNGDVTWNGDQCHRDGGRGIADVEWVLAILEWRQKESWHGIGTIFAFIVMEQGLTVSHWVHGSFQPGNSGQTCFQPVWTCLVSVSMTTHHSGRSLAYELCPLCRNSEDTLSQRTCVILVHSYY